MVESPWMRRGAVISERSGAILQHRPGIEVVFDQLLTDDDSSGAAALAVAPYFRKKRMLSLIGAGLLLVPALPLMCLIACAVKLCSRGPVFYHQQRLGRFGEEFTIMKFRTMRVDAEAGTGPVWSTKGDPRVTFIGRFLRATHLDELPQLFNVLRGEMALIGPRPERPEIVSRLVESVPEYEARLLVAPGITGLAQIQLPPDETLDCVRAKVAKDIEYIRSATFAMDVRILLCTFAKQFGLVKPARAVILPTNVARV